MAAHTVINEGCDGKIFKNLPVFVIAAHGFVDVCAVFFLAAGIFQNEFLIGIAQKEISCYLIQFFVIFCGDGFFVARRL